jgi:phospholipase C
MSIRRREFLTGLGSVAGLTGLRSWNLEAAPRAASFWQVERALPDPTASGIEHIVVVMMENRSFDHLLGWLPGADGRQQGLAYVDSDGQVHTTHALAPDYTGCGHPDPDHSYEGGRIQYDGGAMDGFLRSAEDEYAIGYYVAGDRPFFSALARHYTVLDRSFCSILGPTFPNRFFLHAAQTDRLSNTFDIATMPTIWDALEGAGISGRYYYNNLPFLGLWGLTYLPISRPYSEFLADAAAGALPAVSFVDPVFTVLDDGTGNDDHPHADIRRGDAFLSEAFHAVASGPAWPSTVFIVTYDEWGGFFDHVPPPRADAPNDTDPDLIDGKALLGLRVPTVVASPWTRTEEGDEARVKHPVTDHTSILKLIEWRWGLSPLTSRDASSDVRNMADVLAFHRPIVEVPPLPTPIAPPPMPCLLSAVPSSLTVEAGSPAAIENEWLGLQNSGFLRAGRSTEPDAQLAYRERAGGHVTVRRRRHYVLDHPDLRWRQSMR